MPANCSQDNFCKLAQLIMGKDAVLYLNGNINLKGFKLAAGIKDRKITESVKLSSVEVYVSVSRVKVNRNFCFNCLGKSSYMGTTRTESGT